MLLNQLQDRLLHYRPEPDRLDAAVLVPVTDELEPRLILTRRSSHLNSHAGQVAFPGGKRDSTDASIIATALRESREEIGLPEKEVAVLGQLDVFTSLMGLRVQPIVGKVPGDIPLTPNPDEIESIFRVPLDFFLNEKPAFNHKISYFGQDVFVPSFNYGDYVIWGLTAYMIVDMMNRVYDAGIDFQQPSGLVLPTQQPG